MVYVIIISIDLRLSIKSLEDNEYEDEGHNEEKEDDEDVNT